MNALQCRYEFVVFVFSLLCLALGNTLAGFLCVYEPCKISAIRSRSFFKLSVSPKELGVLPLSHFCCPTHESRIRHSGIHNIFSSILTLDLPYSFGGGRVV